MIHQTKGILLHRFKYSDSKLILKILTREFGLQSYLFFVSVSAKKKSILNVLQPMYLLDLQVYHKNNTGLQKIRDISAGKVLINLPFDIYKQTISLFLAEFLLKMLQENQTDKELFDFIYNSVISLDNETKDFRNFHVFFLYRLTEFLGVKPKNNYSDSKKIFDLQKAKFIIGQPNHPYFLNENKSRKFYELIKLNNFNQKGFKLSNFERKFLLRSMIDFYNLHLDRPGKLKSLEILAQVFS